MKEFNVTGLCIPERHYMVDISNKLKLIIETVDKGAYFTIIGRDNLAKPLLLMS